MSEETIHVSGEITKEELDESIKYLVHKMRRPRRLKWSPIESVALKVFYDEIQEHFKNKSIDNG